MTAAENKIPSVSNLVKKTDYDAKVSDIEKKLTDHTHDEYIITAEFNKLTAAYLVRKTDFDNKLTDLKRKIISNETKDLVIENELKKLKAFDSVYFLGKTHFDEGGAQNYLLFQSVLKYFTLNSKWVKKWKSKGLSNESHEVVSTSNNTLTPAFIYYGYKIRLRFKGSVLEQKTVTYKHKKVVNLYAVYEITDFHGVDDYPTLTNALFGAVKLTKNVDIDWLWNWI